MSKNAASRATVQVRKGSKGNFERTLVLVHPGESLGGRPANRAVRRRLTCTGVPANRTDVIISLFEGPHLGERLLIKRRMLDLHGIGVSEALQGCLVLFFLSLFESSEDTFP